MPKLDLTLNTQQSKKTVEKVVIKLTSLTQMLLQKNPKVTRIHIYQNQNQCFVNTSYKAEQSVFDLVIYITKGINTEKQKTKWLQATHQYLTELLGEGSSLQTNYISIIELDAGNWGYNGLSQLNRNH